MRSAFNAANIALVCGPLAGLLVFMILPTHYTDIEGPSVELSSAARAAAAVATIMAVWWMTEAISVYVTALLPLAWILLTKIMFPLVHISLATAADYLRNEHAALGKFSRGEFFTLCVFLVIITMWITRPLLNRIEIYGSRPFEGLTDPGIAMLVSVVLFLMPVSLRNREFLMDWQTAVRLPWGQLILFGGGLALTAALADTGFSQYLATRAAGLADMPSWLVVLIVVGVGVGVGVVVFLTELTSNTALTATAVPVLLAVAIGLGLSPFLLIIPAAFAASCAFMLPVATPPNAIVFGTGLVTTGQMSRAGFWLNIVSICLITTASYAIIIPALGITL